MDIAPMLETTEGPTAKSTSAPRDPKGKAPVRQPPRTNSPHEDDDIDSNSNSVADSASDSVVADVLLSNCPVIRGLAEANRSLSLYRLREAYDRYTRFLSDVAPVHPVAFINRSLCLLLLGYPNLAVIDSYRALICIDVLKQLPAQDPKGVRVLLDLRMYTTYADPSIEPWMVRPTCYVGDGELEFLNVDLASIHVEGNPRAKIRKSSASKDDAVADRMFYEISMKARYRMALGLWKLGGGAWQSAKDQLATASELDYCTESDRKEMNRLENKIYGEIDASLTRESEVMKNLKDVKGWTDEQIEAHKALGIDCLLKARFTKVRREMYPWDIDIASRLGRYEASGVGLALKEKVQRGTKGKCILRIDKKSSRPVIIAAKPHATGNVILGERPMMHVVATFKEHVQLQCHHCGAALAISPEAQRKVLTYNEQYAAAVARVGLSSEAAQEHEHTIPSLPLDPVTQHGKENESNKGKVPTDEKFSDKVNQPLHIRESASTLAVTTSPTGAIVGEDSIERGKGKRASFLTSRRDHVSLSIDEIQPSSATPTPNEAQFAIPSAPASTSSPSLSESLSASRSGSMSHRFKSRNDSATRDSRNQGKRHMRSLKGVSEDIKIVATIETVDLERLEQLIFGPSERGLPDRPSGFQICPCCRTAYYCSRDCYMTAIRGHHKSICRFRCIEHSYDLEAPNGWGIPSPIATKLLDQMTQNLIVAATNDLHLGPQQGQSFLPEDNNIVGISNTRLVQGDLAPPRTLPDDSDEGSITLWDDSKSVPIEELYPHYQALEDRLKAGVQRKDTHHDIDISAQSSQDAYEPTIDWSYCTNVLLPMQTIYHIHRRQGNTAAQMAILDIKRFDGWMLETLRTRTAATMRIARFPRFAKRFDDEGNLIEIKNCPSPENTTYPNIPDGGFAWTACTPHFVASIRKAKNVMPGEQKLEGQKEPNVKCVERNGDFYIQTVRAIEEGEELLC